MSGTFTLTGRLMFHDNITAHVDAKVVITSPVFPDSVDETVFSSGVPGTVTDGNGEFSIPVVTDDAGLLYTISSPDDFFAPVTFLAPDAGVTVDLSALVPYNPPDGDLDGGTA